MSTDEKQSHGVWYKNPPTKCQMCEDDFGRPPFAQRFYDARTVWGWAHLCGGCFVDNRCSLGTGQGQEYVKQPDGRWLKVAG